MSRFAIRRGVTTAMLFLCLTGFGLYALYKLPLNQLPEVQLPVIAVVTSYTGASPQDIETLLTEPIERAVSAVERVDSVSSESRQGTSVVLIRFTWGTDMDAAEIEVRKNLELFAEELLPTEAGRPLTFNFDPELAPVVFMALDGPLNGHQLRRIAEERVRPYLNRVEGVAAAEVIGGLAREIQVRPKTTWLEAYRISPSQLVDALRGANVVTPSGAVDDGQQRMNISPTSLFASVEEIEEVVIGERGGQPVRVRDVADVVDGFEEETQVVTADGASAVMVAVRKQSDANTVQVAQAIASALPSVKDRLPEGVRIVTLFDESQSILRALSNLALTALQAFFLTGLVLLIFLRSWRSGMIALVAIPTSIVVAFLVMYALDVTLNLISMAGLALAVGMLVDNAIVVLEAAYQQLERGKTPSEAALFGAQEMSMPLTASTLTTVVVFVPVLLVEGIAGELFRDMVLSICVTLLSSLVVAISLVPLMASRLLGADRDDAPIRRWLLRRTRFLDALGPGYQRGLGWSLRHKAWVLGGSLVLFAVSLACLPLLGLDFLPATDNSEVRVEVSAAPGTSLTEMRRRMGQVEAVMRETIPEIEILTATYGTSGGFSAVTSSGANKGTLRARLPKPSERARSQQEVEADLAARFAELPGLDIEIQGFSLGGTAGDVEVQLISEDLDELRASGIRLRAALAQVDGVRELRFSMMQGSPELALRYDRERMRLLGIAPGVVANTVATYYQGVNATVFREDGSEYLVRVRASREARSDFDRLRYLPIPTPGGLTVPLATLVDFSGRLGPVDIERQDQRRLATISVSKDASVDLGTLITRVERAIAEAGVPEGMGVELAGAAEDLEEASTNLALALLAALLLVYMVMASQFESLLEPFVIMFTVPLSVVGVVAALAVTGTTLQVTAVVGIILLGGVVVNNGIVLIDVIKRRVAEGSTLEAASLEAARTRLRPILMTALTTILGMLPLSVGVGDGAETWSPMARAVVGGMMAGTGLTLFVIPTLYVAVAGFLARRSKRNAPKGLRSVPPSGRVIERTSQEAA